MHKLCLTALRRWVGFALCSAIFQAASLRGLCAAGTTAGRWLSQQPIAGLSEQPFRRVTMYVTPEQVAAANKANVEAVLGFAQSNFAALERLSALHFTATLTAWGHG